MGPALGEAGVHPALKRPGPLADTPSRVDTPPQGRRGVLVGGGGGGRPPGGYACRTVLEVRGPDPGLKAPAIPRLQGREGQRGRCTLRTGRRSSEPGLTILPPCRQRDGAGGGPQVSLKPGGAAVGVKVEGLVGVAADSTPYGGEPWAPHRRGGESQPGLRDRHGGAGEAMIPHRKVAAQARGLRPPLGQGHDPGQGARAPRAGSRPADNVYRLEAFSRNGGPDHPSPEGIIEGDAIKGDQGPPRPRRSDRA